MSNTLSALAFSGALILPATSAFAQTPQTVVPTGAEGGAIPPGAAAYGFDANGRKLYVCIAPIGGGRQIGTIWEGANGCAITFAGRPVTIATYSVLASPPPAGARGRATAGVIAPGVVAGRADRLPPSAVATPVMSPGAIVAPPAGATPGSVITNPIKRGFDDSGRPYREQVLPDGSVRRAMQNGTIITKPDGTKQQTAMMFQEAPLPTPPQLPADPALGRAWVERQNANLLEVIRALVDFKTDEMTKFTAGEQTAVGSDVFAQVNYRSTIAFFLAQGS